jgi:hypothetical protein
VSLYYCAQDPQVLILNVSPITSEVDRDAACTSKIGQHCGGGDARLPSAPRLSYGRDVIDVHIESNCHFQPFILLERS